MLCAQCLPPRQSCSGRGLCMFLGLGSAVSVVSAGMFKRVTVKLTHFSELLIPFLFCDAHSYCFRHLACRNYDANFLTCEALWDNWFAGNCFGRYRRHGGCVRGYVVGLGWCVVIAEVLRRFPSAKCARKSLFGWTYSKTATQCVLVGYPIACLRRRW